MKVIFLDIDGVLVTRGSLKKASGLRSPFDPDCVEALNFLVEESKAVIVVTSSWKRILGLEELKDVFEHHGVIAEMIATTPNILGSRGDEIERWLTGKDRIESFVILDDDSDMFPYEDNLVRTDSSSGLTLESVNKALKILGVAG